MLDVHVQAMNDKKLIELMNKVYDNNQNKVPRTDLMLSLDNLVNYTIKHFTDEEQYMESIFYPKLKSHKLIHEDLLKKVTAFVEEFNKTGTLEKKFFDFLKNWLIAHIREIDTKYGDFKPA